MNITEMIHEISAKDVDVEKFVRLAIRDDHARDEIIKQLITNPDIMVYYHCFYIVAKASQERPELFYQYWFEIASLLEHKNSYHRDIALTILANLTQVDQDNLFSEIFNNYFEHIHDKKFMTGKCCIQNSIKILRNKHELNHQIITLLLDVDKLCAYPEKQKELLKYDVLEILDEVYEEAIDKKGVDEFIKAGASSISPKTRRKAKELVGKYGSFI
jgi:hypothetical protein